MLELYDSEAEGLVGLSEAAGGGAPETGRLHCSPGGQDRLCQRADAQRDRAGSGEVPPEQADRVSGVETALEDGGRDRKQSRKLPVDEERFNRGRCEKELLQPISGGV